MPLRRQLIEYRKNVELLLDVKGEKFSYAVLKNKAHIESAFEDLKRDITKLSTEERESQTFKDYLKFVEERETIASKYAKKDEEGKPLTEKVNTEKGEIERYIIEDEKSLEKEVAELSEKDEKILEDRKNQEIEFLNLENAIYDEEIELDIHMVSEVPDSITARELAAAEFMIKK